MVITPVVLVIVGLLKYANILTDEWGSLPVMAGLSISSIFLIQLVVGHNEKNARESLVHYEHLDAIRYLSAISIVILHLRPFLGIHDELDLVFNNIVGRTCVPMFLMVTGYFVSIKEEHNPKYIQSYLRHMIPVYLVWSILYIPLGLNYIEQMNLPVILYPVALLIAIFYTGMYYHLWYFPALFISVFLLGKWVKRWKLKYLLILSFLLLCFGASETYYGVLPVPLQHFLSQYYFDIFLTTRNFLFFGLFYVTFGYFIGKHRFIYVPYSFLKFLICVVLLVVETLILQKYDRLDSNILFSCIPLVYYLFVTLIHTKKMTHIPSRYHFRDLFKYYYLIHPLIIFIVLQYQKEHPLHYLLSILLVLSLTHAATLLLIEVKRKFPKIPL